MQVKIMAEGGAMKPGPSLSQQLGPAGVNINQVIQAVNEATKDFKGLEVPVELVINDTTKEFTVNVFSPPVSGLIKRELGIEKGSGVQKRFQAGNASIEQIISVAKQKQANLLAKDLKAAVKLVAGTCLSLGVLIEDKPAVEVMAEIEEGKYDTEIREGRTETPEEKKKALEESFTKLHAAQEKIKKAEAAAKAAEEEKKKK